MDSKELMRLLSAVASSLGGTFDDEQLQLQSIHIGCTRHEDSRATLALLLVALQGHAGRRAMVLRTMGRYLSTSDEGIANDLSAIADVFSLLALESAENSCGQPTAREVAQIVVKKVLEMRRQIMDLTMSGEAAAAAIKDRDERINNQRRVIDEQAERLRAKDPS